MASTMVSMRVEDSLLEWADDFARRRKLSRTQLVHMALVALRDDARGGVPDPPAEQGPDIPKIGRWR
jgi:hypothetical protein